jgi:rare lipoprotein A
MGFNAATFVRLLSVLCFSFVIQSFSLGEFEEYGKASYYSDALHGRKTASGEPYDKTAYSCAHKSLPFGTKVKVTRMDNQLSVVATVNDRGPFKEGFVVELSRRGAEAIGLVKDGVTLVKVEVVQSIELPTSANLNTAPTNTSKVPLPSDKPAAGVIIPKTVTAPKPVAHSNEIERPVTEPRTIAPSTTTPNTTTKGIKSNTTGTTAKTVKAPHTTQLFKVDSKTSNKQGFGVQVSTLSDANNVLPFLAKLEKNWPGKTLVIVDTDDATQISTYKVLIGSYPTKQAAENQQKLIAKKGYPKCFVVDLKGI